jgi:hypothetical protein
VKVSLREHALTSGLFANAIANTTANNQQPGHQEYPSGHSQQAETAGTIIYPQFVHNAQYICTITTLHLQYIRGIGRIDRTPVTKSYRLSREACYRHPQTTTDDSGNLTNPDKTKQSQLNMNTPIAIAAIATAAN